MTANKSFYSFEKTEERGKKKFKKNIAHNYDIPLTLSDLHNKTK